MADRSPTRRGLTDFLLFSLVLLAILMFEGNVSAVLIHLLIINQIVICVISKLRQLLW